MRVRGIRRSATTWSFRAATEENKILCDDCDNRELRDSCPRFTLNSAHRRDLVAVRCNFHATQDSD